MNLSRLKKALNFLWYQLVWFTAVLGGESATVWLAALLVIHLSTTVDWRSEAILMLSAAFVGAATELVIAALGYYQFEATAPGLSIPLWLVVIWMGFAATFRSSLSWMVARPRLMTVLALIAAPLTYLTAGRLGAVSFPASELQTAAVIAGGWVVALPLLLLINRRLELWNASFQPALVPDRTNTEY